MAFFDNFVRTDFKIALDFFVIKFAADKTLDAVDGVFWISYALTLGDFAYEAFAFFGNGDYGRGSTVAFRICNNFWLAGDHVSESAVGGAEVNTDDF